jgi:hypothetical protein
VIITGALLAESAEVVDNKLQVSGGVLTNVMVGPNRSAQFVVVVLTHAEGPAPSSAGRHAVTDNADQHLQVEIEIRPPTGKALQLQLEMPEDLVDAEVGCAFFPIELELPFDGRHVIVMTRGGVTISLPLTVHS